MPQSVGPLLTPREVRARLVAPHQGAWYLTETHCCPKCQGPFVIAPHEIAAGTVVVGPYRDGRAWCILAACPHCQRTVTIIDPQQVASAAPPASRADRPRDPVLLIGVLLLLIYAVATTAILTGWFQWTH